MKMLITSEKIEVSEQMMFNEGLSRSMITGELGIPASATQKEPITWKNFMDMEDEEFDLIEEYFINKTKKS